MSKPSKLANPNSFAVRDALTRTCPACGSLPKIHCVTTTRTDHKRLPLPGDRIVHYARAKFRTDGGTE